MPKLEIPVCAWPAFAKAFNRQHENDRVTVFSESRRGEQTAIARDVVFRNLAVDIEAGQRSVVVTLEGQGDRHLSHTISKPVAIFYDGSAINVKSELGTGFTIALAAA